MVARRTVLSGMLGIAAARRAPAGPERFAAAADAARKLNQLHCLVIAQDGATVFAESFRGPQPDRPVNVKSVSKTLVASVTGAAIDRGVVPGIGATLGDVAPGLIPPDADPRVAGLTLEDLVTMRAGLARTSGPNYGAWVASPNWVAYALRQPFVADPGAAMLYSTGSYHVLGAALAEASGQNLLAMSRDWIGEPLGIDIPPWTRDPQGFFLGGNEMALSPLALLRFGEMVRQHGNWRGTQVLSSDWVQESLRPRTRSPYSGLAYGYGWFLGRGDRTTLALARGYGGQVVALAPARRLTVVITSDPTRPARSAGYFGDLMALLTEKILPAARS
ncbi:MAG: serine hydrolase [Rhodobacteraceae bacterium]|nr:serine hydrolase [Paracoccaceae bacterium]